MNPEMECVRCSILRGGTSKGIYVMENELPKKPEQRDKVIKAIFGSPDLRQIDGLGGADTLTSKLAIVGRSDRADADVSYTFAQVGIEQDIVDYGGNCGNISAGVGPFAIDAGLVKAVEPITIVKIHQTNTDRILVAEVPVKSGKASVEGDFSIDGVPGTGARITMDFSSTAGAVTGKTLPTGNEKDVITVNEKVYEVSIVDAGNPVVFIKAEQLDISGTETAAEIDAEAGLLKILESIRSEAAVMAGMVTTARQATLESPYAPFIAMISNPADYVSASGKQIKSDETDLLSRLVFMGKMHKTYPGTGAVCTGAAARIPGTVPYELLSDSAKEAVSIRIGHPSGIMTVESIRNTEEDDLSFRKLAFYRTARKIMDGVVYIRKSSMT